MITAMIDVYPHLPCAEDPGLTVKEVAAELRVSERTVRNMIARGDLRAGRVAEQWRVLRRDLRAYLESVWR